MFGISFGEFCIIAILGFCFLSKDDCWRIVNFIKNLKQKMQIWYSQYSSYIEQALKQGDFITDLEGKKQITYDIKKIMPDLIKDE